MKKRKVNTQPFWRFTFLVYCGFMLWLLFGRTSGVIEGLSYEETLRHNINLTPLLTIRNYWYVILHRSNETMVRHCIINLAGNVLLFIPAGWLLPRLWKPMRNFFLFFLTCTLAIFLVELVQLFTLLGRFDVDDLILNLSGMLLGYLYYTVCAAIRNKRGKRKS